MSEAQPACLLVDAGCSVSRSLAVALARQGWAVAVIVEDSRAEVADHYSIFACRMGERSTVQTAFDTAVRQVGAPRFIVLSMVPGLLMQSAAIDQMPSATWTGSLHAALVATVHVLQAAERALSPTGGTIILLAPAVALVGATHLAALSILLEAQRALVKSAARQWGAAGVRVHWVGVGAVGNYPELQGAVVPMGPELGPPPPALGRIPDVNSGVTQLITMLASDAAACMTGSTLVADGGEWMVP